MKTLNFLFMVIVTVLLSSTVKAQVNDSTAVKDTTKQLYLVTKTDGGEFYGYIVSDDGRELLLETKNIGKIYISKADIASILEVADSESKKYLGGGYSDYRNEGPFTTRYYLTTNALPIKKGENYAMLHLYGPEVHFAVSDNLSLGVMSSWIASPIMVAAKYSFDSETNTHFALGSIVGSSGFLFNASGFGGLHWATVTQGDRRANVSFSAGFGHISFGGGRNESFYGPKYSMHSSEHQVNSKVSSYRRESDAIQQLTGNTSYSNNYLYKEFKNGRSAPVLSVSGITPVGKKASFIFDVMAFLPSFYTNEVASTFTLPNVTSSYYTYDGPGGTRQEKTETRDVLMNQHHVVKKGVQPTILIMPGMRFNQSHNKAFQVVLAGVIAKDRYGDVLTFPVPMVSWLRTF